MRGNRISYFSVFFIHYATAGSGLCNDCVCTVYNRGVGIPPILSTLRTASATRGFLASLFRQFVDFSPIEMICGLKFSIEARNPHNGEASVLMQRRSYPNETVLYNKITRNRIVLSFKASPRKPLRRRPEESNSTSFFSLDGRPRPCNRDRAIRSTETETNYTKWKRGKLRDTFDTRLRLSAFYSNICCAKLKDGPIGFDAKMRQNFIICMFCSSLILTLKMTLDQNRMRAK